MNENCNPFQITKEEMTEIFQQNNDFVSDKKSNEPVDPSRDSMTFYNRLVEGMDILVAKYPQLVTATPDDNQ